MRGGSPSSSTYRPTLSNTCSAAATPAIQVNVDATAMVQAGLGSGYAQQIITTEIQDFLSRKEGAPLPPVNIDVRVMFNPNIDTAWFTSVMGIINNITMLGDHSCRRRDRARTRARHHGPSVGHAIDAVRDCHVESLGQRAGDHHRRRPVALSRRSHASACSDRRLGAAVHARRRDLSVLHLRHRHISWARSRAPCRSSVCCSC